MGMVAIHCRDEDDAQIAELLSSGMGLNSVCVPDHPKAQAELIARILREKGITAATTAPEVSPVEFMTGIRSLLRQRDPPVDFHWESMALSSKLLPI